MTSLAMIALLIICYGWHRLRCKRCRRQESRDDEWVRAVVLESLERIQARKQRRIHG